MSRERSSFFGVLAVVLLGITICFIYRIYKWQYIILFITGSVIVGWILKKIIKNKTIELLKKISAPILIIQCFGLLISLMISVLLSVIIRPLIENLSSNSQLLILLSDFILVNLAAFITISVKAKELSLLFFNVSGQNPKKMTGNNDFKVLDTSAIIDGRIADLCKTGFLEGILIIPNFVLNEIQKIADSADSLRRNRGRRGLDLLNKIQKENQVAIRIFDRDYEELEEVDTKLLRLARELEAKVITNDFNLNKVAELYGVKVLNINDLSNAIKPVVLPGEEMLVRIIRDGKEFGQGIAYLEDGTMIVVEGGKSFIGADLIVLVTSVLQTSAGRMIFAKPKEYLAAKITS